MYKQLPLMLLVFFISTQLFANNKRISVLEGIQQKSIQIKAERTKHSFNEKGLTLFIKNLSKEPLVVSVDPALIFEANDTSYQDLIIPGSETLYAGVGKTQSLDIQTYCAKGWSKSPEQSIKFSLKKQADSNTIKTFQFLRKINASKYLTQQTV